MFIVTEYAALKQIGPSIRSLELVYLGSHSSRVVFSYKRKYVHEVLVNRLFELAQEKVWLGEV